MRRSTIGAGDGFSDLPSRVGGWVGYPGVICVYQKKNEPSHDLPLKFLASPVGVY